MPSQVERDNLIAKLLENKLIMLPSGDQSIRFRPHLNVTETDLNRALEILQTTIKSILN